jgi:WD40 repeat protein
MKQPLVPHAPLAFTRDGTLVAITRTSHAVQLVEAANPQRELATLTAPHGHLITALAFNPDGTQLAVAATDEVVQLWDLRLLRQQLAELGLDWDRPPYPAPQGDPGAEPIQVAVLPGPVRTGAVIGESHLEAEDVPVVAANAPYEAQAMKYYWPPNWSNGRILLCQTPQNGYVEVELECPSPGRHLLDISFARAPDFGTIAVSVDGRNVGKTFDGYHEYVSPTGPIFFGALELSAGRHRLRFTAIDKNPKSRGYHMGIDYLTLRLVR